MPTILFTPDQIDTLSDAAEAAYPNEACGLLVGTGGGEDDFWVSRVVPTRNVIESQAHDRFEVDPQARINLMRELRAAGNGDRLIGHFHSHPDHGSLPSETDLSLAFEPELVWVITSVVNGHARETSAHLIDPATGRFREIEVRTATGRP